MKLTSLRVENFKCIDDCTSFHCDQITCLLGKNEAGKSALLEALYKLNPFEKDKGNFELEEFPRRRVSTYRERKEQKEHANVLTTTWALEAHDRDAVTALYGPEALHVDDKGRSFVAFSKGYDNILKPSVECDDAGVARHYLGTSRLTPDEQAPLREAASVHELIQALEQNTQRGPNHQALLGTLQKTFPASDAATAIGLFLKERLPVFLYFREYDKLPGRVSLQDYKTRKGNNTLEKGHKIFAALLELANSSPEDIETIGKLERLTMELEAVQARLSDEIFEYWSQNMHLAVKFSCDQGRNEEPPPFNAGMVFTTRIWNERHRASVLLDQRSSGFLWFFSFLVWFSQVKKQYGSNIFLLLDEPGLSLHGKAQKDLLRYFNEKLRPFHQVMYSTHSPFSIDTEHVFSIRTVEDVIEKVREGRVETERVLGTKVSQRILSRDPDTLLPLQGICGFDIAQTMFVGPYVLVVEGPSEAGYISWFSQFLHTTGRTGHDIRWAIAPAESASKVSSFVSLFSGRGLKIAALLDYHKEQKRMVEELERSHLLDEGRLLRTTDFTGQAESDIEDLIGWPLYAALVNGALGLPSHLALPATNPGPQQRVAKAVEEQMLHLPPGFPEFDHYQPVRYLRTLTGEQAQALPGFADAAERFEELFKRLNGLIDAPGSSSSVRSEQSR